MAFCLHAIPTRNSCASLFYLSHVGARVTAISECSRASFKDSHEGPVNSYEVHHGLLCFLRNPEVVPGHVFETSFEWTWAAWSASDLGNPAEFLGRRKATSANDAVRFMGGLVCR